VDIDISVEYAVSIFKTKYSAKELLYGKKMEESD
jgi:hypothetical protein